MQILLQILQNKKKNIENIFSHFQEEREKELLYSFISSLIINFFVVLLFE